jgi:hypothetical protein
VPLVINFVYHGKVVEGRRARRETRYRDYRKRGFWSRNTPVKPLLRVTTGDGACPPAKLVLTPEHRMTKPYHEMTPAERLSARIAKNREIDQRVQDKKPAESATPAAKKQRGTIGIQAKPARNALDKFQEIKKSQGIDAASDFVHSRLKSAHE